MDFLDTLSSMYVKPSVNSAPFMAETTNVTLVKNSINTNEIQYQQELALALYDYSFYTVSVENGVVQVTDNRQTDIETAKQRYNMIEANGVLTLELINNPIVKTGSIEDMIRTQLKFDQSDVDEYAGRYTSFDTKYSPEDGSNIAFMRIVDAKTHTTIWPIFPLGQVPSPGITTNKFKQFILTQITNPMQERMQVVETNAEYQALFYDSKPEIMQLSGVLKNTIENPWTINMVYTWDYKMRGTQLIKSGCICQIFADGELFEGYPFQFQRSKVAGSDYMVSFSMGFLIRKRVTIDKRFKNDSK
jgi:hypothetical protein